MSRNKLFVVISSSNYNVGNLDLLTTCPVRLDLCVWTTWFEPSGTIVVTSK